MKSAEQLVEEYNPVYLMPVPKGYIRTEASNTACNPCSYTEILPDGTEKYIIIVPQNAIIGRSV